MFRKEINFDRFVRGLLAAVLFTGCCWLLNYLSAVLVPFFVAWMAAYLLYPVVQFFEKRCRLRSRVLSILVTLLLTGGVLTGLAWVTLPALAGECVHLKEVALAYIENGVAAIDIPEEVGEMVTRHVREYGVDRMLREADIAGTLRTAVPQVWAVVWSTAGMLVSFAASLIAVLYLFLLLLDYERYATGWLNFVPRGYRSFAATLAADIEHGMRGYFRGQALVALSNCVMFSVGFLVVGFPVPVGLGVFIGLISFVPYLQVAGIVPAAVLALLAAIDTGASFWLLMAEVLAVYVVVQILQDTVFTPKIMGRIMGLPPAVVLLALSVWGYALGITGLIIALPATTLMISYYRRYVVPCGKTCGALSGGAPCGANGAPGGDEAEMMARLMEEEERLLSATGLSLSAGCGEKGEEKGKA